MPTRPTEEVSKRTKSLTSEGNPRSTRGPRRPPTGRSSGRTTAMAAAPVNGDGHREKADGDAQNGHRAATTMFNAVGGTVPVTEWDRLSADSRFEIEHLLEVLKSVK